MNAHSSPNSSGVPNRLAGICERDLGLDLGDRAAGLLRRERHARAQPVGREASGQDVVDGDVALDRLPRDSCDEASQAGAGAVEP